MVKKYGGQSCPDTKTMEPCQCKSKTSGLDITCESIDIKTLKKVTTKMKQFNINKHKELLVSKHIKYYYILCCNIGILWSTTY